ncbi:MAG: DNA polymerase III subunit delta' [Firmicutes bacterium]|nr:DNA polymerase III subunit delta' [Bacillota bacterium]
MDFNDIVGHDNIKNNLRNAIRNENVAHGYLFQGAKGIGKKRMALTFAKTLLCEKLEDNPCDTCPSCLKFESKNHPDLIVEKPDGNSFKKEQIDNIQRDIRTFPYEGNRKIFILEDIDKMTKEAQNSFLKTLEEPPSYVVIIMTVINSYSLLPTIVSRSQLIKFNQIENSLIENELKNKYNKDEQQSRFIASFSNGIMGKALKLCESEEFKVLREDLIEIIDDLINKEKFRVFTFSDFFEKNKENIDDIMDMMLIWFRDLLFMKELVNEDLIINKDKISILTNECQKIPKDKIHDIIKVVKRTKNDINKKVNFQLAIELMLLKIQEV